MSMERSESDDCEERLKQKDLETIVNRAVRFQRMTPFKIHRVPTFRIVDYCEEAESSFINGCFRSCIICSALAVEQALKHTLIFQSEDWEETYWEIEVKRVSFRDIIRRAEKSSGISKESLKDADWLRQARNEVAAHPLYIGTYLEPSKKGHLQLKKETDEIIWANKIMFRDIRKLLRFLEPSKLKEIEEKKISTREPQGKILEEYSVKDFVKRQRFDISNFILWFSIQSEIIEEIAFNAYRRMVEIMNLII